MEEKAVLKVLNDGKWWIASIALLASVILLSRYLWVVGHAELITDSISSPPFLYVWLLFSVLVFFALIWIACVPSVIFLVTMSAIKIDRAFESDVAKRFLSIVFLGFIGFSFGLLLATFYEYQIWWIFIWVAILILLGMLFFYRLDNEFRIMVVGADNGKNKTLRILRFLGVSGALGVTALSGVFPGQLALMIWRGGEEGWQGRTAILLCLFMMAVYFFPVIYFYCVSGTFLQRARGAFFVLLCSFLFNVMAFPALSDIFVYAAANMLKLRDSQVLDYVLSDKEYPPGIFDKNEWNLSRVEGGGGLYRLAAFRQFKFGNILLVCPGKYSSVKLKEISGYADKCVSLDNSKVKLIITKSSGFDVKRAEPVCGLVVIRSAEVPYLWKRKDQCAYDLPRKSTG